MPELEILKEPAKTGSAHPPLLFIHGAWHGAWCWHRFMDYFSENGFDCFAVSLRGHGNSPREKSMKRLTVSEYVADVAKAVETITGEKGKPPILVGHSMGGLIVQKYLETGHGIPLAVLLAPVPVHGVIFTTLRTLYRMPGTFLRVNATLSLRPLVRPKARAREMFFSEDIPDADLDRYYNLLQDESYAAFLGMLAFSLPCPEKVKTPILVLGAEKDTIFSVSEIEKTASEYGVLARIFENIAHDMMLETSWRDVADYIRMELENHPALQSNIQERMP